MYSEEEFLPLSGLQHTVYCERQAALIHIDRIWVENAFTVEGKHLHDKVDDGRGEVRNGVKVLRAVPLRSMELGLVGKADVVELHPSVTGERGAAVPEVGEGLWTAVPVEYKRGRPKRHRADEVQLCAQALCLEESLGTSVARGYLYYGKPRRRTEVVFDEGLREYTCEIAHAFHDLVRSGEVPVRMRDSRCERCSLVEVCMPPSRRWRGSARGFLREWLNDALGEAGR